MNSTIKAAISDEAGRIDAVKAVALASHILKEVAASGYIPFASPCPSSSEVEVRDRLRSNIRALDSTLYLMCELYGDHPLPGAFCKDCVYYHGDGPCQVSGASVFSRSLRLCCVKKGGENE